MSNLFQKLKYLNYVIFVILIFQQPSRKICSTSSSSHGSNSDSSSSGSDSDPDQDDSETEEQAKALDVSFD